MIKKHYKLHKKDKNAVQHYKRVRKNIQFVKQTIRAVMKSIRADKYLHTPPRDKYWDIDVRIIDVDYRTDQVLIAVANKEIFNGGNIIDNIEKSKMPYYIGWRFVTPDYYIVNKVLQDYESKIDQYRHYSSQ